MSTLILQSKSLTSSLASRFLSSYHFTPRVITHTSVHLPGMWGIPLLVRPHQHIRRQRPPGRSMPSKSRTIQHALRRRRAHRQLPLHPRHLLPNQLGGTDHPPVLRRFPRFASGTRSAHLHRGLPQWPQRSLIIPFSLGCGLPDLRRRCRLPTLLPGVDTLRTPPLRT